MGTPDSRDRACEDAEATEPRPTTQSGPRRRPSRSPSRSSARSRSTTSRSARTSRGEPDYRCGSIEVPFEREDPSYGTTEIGFAVLPASGESEGAIFAVEGGPGYPSTGTAQAYRKLFGRPARDPRPRARRPAWAGHLRARGLPRPPARLRPGRSGARQLRRAPGQALHLVPHGGRGGRHRLGAPGARLRGDRALRRLVRHLPRPVVRLSPRRQARGARPRLGLPDLRRERRGIRACPRPASR